MYIFLLVIVLIGFSTYVGLVIFIKNETGNFYVSPEVNNRSGITLSDDMSFPSFFSRIKIESNVDKNNMTYDAIKLDEIFQSDGQYIDLEQGYLAYTFYIRNVGTETITVDYYMRCTEIYNSMDEYVRILIIEDDTTYRMYQKADLPNEDNNMPLYNGLPLGLDFESQTIIFSDSFDKFKPGEVKRFRVIIWLEKQDPDINDDFQSGNIKVQLNFKINEKYETSQSESLLNVNEKQNLFITLVSICNVEFEIYYGHDENS